MGLLQRLFGGPPAPRAAATVQAHLNGFSFNRLRDEALLQVVGEAYRQELVLRARPPRPDELPPNVPPPPPGLYKAMLTPQPTNEYDRNAIMVVLWSGDGWSLAGYLSRGDAVEYRPLFARLAQISTDGASPAICCDANLVPERGGTGVELHLGTPGECAAELAIDGGTLADHPLHGRPVVFTGEGATTLYGVPVDRCGQQMLARWAGCELLPRMTKKAAALIVADERQVTGNLQKARDYGVPVIPEPDFYASIGVPLDAIGRLAGRWAGGYAEPVQLRPPAPPPAPVVAEDPVAALASLKALHDAGLISDQEFDEKRSATLARI